MTRDETVMVMVRIKAVWPSFARQQSREEKEAMVAVWSEALLAVTPEDARQAVDHLRDDQGRLANVPPTLPDLMRAIHAVRAGRIPDFSRVMTRLEELVRELQEPDRVLEHLRLHAPPEVGQFVRTVGWETLWGYPENGVTEAELRMSWDRIVRQSVFREGDETQEMIHAGNDDQRGVEGRSGSPRRLGAGSQG